MNTLFIADPLEKWRVHKETTPLLAREHQRRGHRVFTTTIDQLWVLGDQPMARVCPLSAQIADAGFDAGEPRVEPLAAFDFIHLRTDPPFDITYYLATQVLELAARRSLVINDPLALRRINEKLCVLEFPDLITDSLVSMQAAEIEAFVRQVGGRAVLKPLYGSGGRGVVELKQGPGLRATIAAALADNGTHVMVQRFIEGIFDGELRLMFLDGVVVGSMIKVPEGDSFLSNLDHGARVERGEPDERERRAARRIGDFLKEHKVLFAAVDLIDGCLSEINITSPALIPHINKLQGVELHVDLVDLAERRLAELRRGQAPREVERPRLACC